MANEKSDIVIIGAGLTGLALAYFLKDKNYSIQIIEARDRIGGRIQTIRRSDLTPIEMGATWFGKKHTALTDLLATLGLSAFEQHLGNRAIYEPLSTSPPQLVQLPPNDAPSYRIQGGTDTLINTLIDNLDSRTSIHTSQQVTSIEKEGEQMILSTTTGKIECSVVVSTLPPYLLLNTIEFTPALPEEVQQIMSTTHIWMGESIKVGIYYQEPFWRTPELSGTIFSNVGPIPEMYDHSNVEDDRYALKGFFNGAYHSVSKTDRLDLVLKQLRKYFGSRADNFIEYEEKIWSKESFTYVPYKRHLIPHQNNGHPAFRQSYCDNKFFIAGSETAALFPGYMDGAVRSAKFVAESIS